MGAREGVDVLEQRKGPCVHRDSNAVSSIPYASRSRVKSATFHCVNYVSCSPQWYLTCKMIHSVN